MKHQWMLVIVALIVFAGTIPAWAAKGRALSDSELDRVTAAGLDVQLLDGKVDFAFDSGTKFANHVSASGSLDYGATALPNGCIAESCSFATLNMATGAQSNLSSLVNIVAVNSLINVLLNLNINVAAAGSTQNVTLSQANAVKAH